MEFQTNQKKEFIILTAIDLIHENGIQSIPTKEIAKRIGISEGLIFKIFPKKKDLILAVIDHFARYDNDMFLTSQNKNDDPLDAILFFMDKYTRYYENYPAITAIYQIVDIHIGFPEVEASAKEITLNRLAFLKQLIMRAQERNRIDPSIEPDTAADILYMIFKGMCMKWRLWGFNFSLSEKTNYAVNLFLQSLTSNYTET
jgi:Transcriptional regulator